MYKLFTSLLVILFTSLTLNAQNSKEEYDNAVDYCACKIAYAYTEDFADKNPNLDEKRSFEDVISKQLNDCEKNNVSSSELEKLLKENKFKGFSKTLIPDVENAKNSFSDSFNKEEAINSILNSFKLSFNKIDIKSELSNGLNIKLQSFENQEDIVIENESVIPQETTFINEANHSNREINQEGFETAESSFFPNWLLFAIIFLASVLLFLSNYLKIKKLKESAKRHRDEIEDLKNKKNIFNQSNNKNQNNSRFERDVYQKISELNIAMERLQNSSIISSSSSVHKSNQVKNIQSTKAKEIQRIMYAKAPNEKGEFKSSDVNENKDGKFYIFTLNSNNETQFEFYNTQNNAIKAVDSPEIFLFPVNDSVAALNQNAKKIITNKPGIAIKQDDKWIVKDKAQITYE